MTTQPRGVTGALWINGWRYLLRRPLQTTLMILGITLGVAVVVAIDLANASASRAFDLSVDAVAGRATHQIGGGPQGLDEHLYTDLRRQGLVDATAPIITEYVTSPQLGDQPLQLLGVDPFAEAPFRNYLSGEEGVPISELTAFLTQPGAVLISTDLAERYGLEPGDPITVLVAGYEYDAHIAGLIEPTDNLSRRALWGLMLADISTAQELTRRTGKLDRIDLILPEDDPGTLRAIEAVLPEGIRAQTVDARSGSVREMTDAFRVNLMALSLLALVVGMFLIYNTMTFSVVQRRALFGTLRCLGVTRREVFLLVMSEALIVGVVGALLGTGLGIILGQNAVRMVTQTINDLFFVVTVRGIQVPITSLIKGALLGVFNTLLTAAPPAWEAASVPPRTALNRSGLESKARSAVTGVMTAGLAAVAAGVGILALPTSNLPVSFAGTFAVIVGFAMLTPATMVFLMRAATPLTGFLWGVLGRMAPRAVIKSLSRTSVAVAALMVAVSVTIGISLMVSSFRHTVIVWLEQTLQGDIYISSPAAATSQPTNAIDPAVLDALSGWPGVESVDTIRSLTVDSPRGPVQLMAANQSQSIGNRLYVSATDTPEEVWTALENGSVIVSEPYANLNDMPRQGGTVTLYTAEGEQTFPVAGIYYDYSSSQGVVMMAQSVYRDLWHDDSVSAVALNLEPGVDPDELTLELKEALSALQTLSIRPNKGLRAEVLQIFDRTFAITGALQILATIVAFIGILSALFALQLDKQQEFGILRAIGLTTRQLWGMVMIETGLMGMVAGLLSMPTGFALSLILVYIINRRSFGWTLQMQIDPMTFVQALAIAVVAALLAGIYPARRMSKMMAAEAIRYE